MSLVVGTLHVGRVDEVAGEAVTTRFLVVGMPVVPLGSELCGFDVGLHGKSIAAAYVRWYCPLLALLWAAVQQTWLVPLALGLVWASSFAWGRASARARALRSALADATRIAAFPAHVPDGCALATYEQLRRDATRGYPRLSLVFALAVYRLELEGRGRSVIASAFAREAEKAILGRPFDAEALDRARGVLLREAGTALSVRQARPRARVAAPTSDRLLIAG